MTSTSDQHCHVAGHLVVARDARGIHEVVADAARTDDAGHVAARRLVSNSYSAVFTSNHCLPDILDPRH